MYKSISHSEKPGKWRAKVSLARQMVIIGLLRREGSGVRAKTTSEIRDALAKKNFKVSPRTVQRDLEQLWAGRAGHRVPRRERPPQGVICASP